MVQIVRALDELPGCNVAQLSKNLAAEHTA
jgi:hypothetical protein